MFYSMFILDRSPAFINFVRFLFGGGLGITTDKLQHSFIKDLSFNSVLWFNHFLRINYKDKSSN